MPSFAQKFVDVEPQGGLDMAGVFPANEVNEIMIASVCAHAIVGIKSLSYFAPPRLSSKTPESEHKKSLDPKYQLTYDTSMRFCSWRKTTPLPPSGKAT